MHWALGLKKPDEQKVHTDYHFMAKLHLKGVQRTHLQKELYGHVSAYTALKWIRFAKRTMFWSVRERKEMLIGTIGFLLHLHSAVCVDFSWFDCHCMSHWYSTKVCYTSVLLLYIEMSFFFLFTVCCIKMLLSYRERIKFHELCRVVRLFVAAKVRPDYTCDNI